MSGKRRTGGRIEREGDLELDPPDGGRSTGPWRAAAGRANGPVPPSRRMSDAEVWRALRSDDVLDYLPAMVLELERRLAEGAGLDPWPSPTAPPPRPAG